MADLPAPAPTTARQTWMAWAAGALVVGVFFRQQISNGFTLLSSDRYDGVIAVALLEHWFSVLRGLAQWNRPDYLFPHPLTLGYNDGYFLYGLVYSLFRGLSLDPFLSSELVNVAVKGLGFAAFHLAARRVLGLAFWWSLLGACVFTLANNSYVQSGHAQLLAVAFAPIEALLMAAAGRALLRGRGAGFVAYGGAAAALFSAWTLTAVYTAWFFALFMAIFLLFWMLLGGRGAFVALRGAVAANKVAVLAVGAIAIVTLMPFVSAYMLGPHGPRAWEEVAVYSPSVLDSVNVGANNLVFGDLVAYLKRACPGCDLGGGEREAGIGPLLFALAALAVAGVLRRRPASRAVAALALASAATWLIAIRLGEHTAWHAIYAYWPGATGLRAVCRIFLFLSAPATALAMWTLSTRTPGWPRPLVAALCVLLLAEEINLGATVSLDRYKELARTTPLQAPPPQCRAFYAGASPDTDSSATASGLAASVVHNVDAMMVAATIHLPTINGHASFLPADWDFGKPAAADYRLRVARYARRHGIAAPCRLDLVTLRWSW